MTRRACPDDARATLAVLTDAGWDQVVAAAPARLCGKIVDRVHDPRAWRVPSTHRPKEAP